MPLVLTEDRGAVRHIVLNRPEERNALSAELVGEFGAAVDEAARTDSVHVVVVRGEGEMFSAGIDPAELGSVSSPGPVLGIWNHLEEMPKPTICQIHGACIGRAMQLALACDLRVMAEDATAALLETRIGLIPALGGCSRLPSVVGLGRAKELVMTGRAIDGHEAHRIGFANRVAPADLLDEQTQTLCDELLACAPLAVGLSKRVMDAAAKPVFGATLEQERAAQQLLTSQARGT